MGSLERCSICGDAVLELEGQFEMLQPYYADPAHPAAELAGEVHTTCLTATPQGPVWAGWRIASYLARGYAVTVEAAGWTVLRHVRLKELIAVHRDGASAVASQKDTGLATCDGGGTLIREREANLTLEDTAFIAAVQRDLEQSQHVPLSRIAQHLRIQDRLCWRAVLDDAEYRFSRPLRRYWSSRSFSAIARYRKFLPDVVLNVWKAL
jgi:hypothetical protein